MYKLRETPKSGRRLWSYMSAILEVTGMDQGKVFNLKRFMTNFSTHIEKGRIEKISGGHKLTDTGIEYFLDRYNEGSRQRVYKNDVDAFIHSIERGGNDDEWIKID